MKKSMGRVYGRRSRSYSVTGGSPYPPDEGDIRFPETSIAVCCFIHKEDGILDRRRERWRDPSVVGVVSPRRPRNDLRSGRSFLKILRAQVERSNGCTNKVAKPNEHVDIIYHWIICHALSLYSSLLDTQTISPC